MKITGVLVRKIRARENVINKIKIALEKREEGEGIAMVVDEDMPENTVITYGDHNEILFIFKIKENENDSPRIDCER